MGTHSSFLLRSAPARQELGPRLWPTRPKVVHIERAEPFVIALRDDDELVVPVTFFDAYDGALVAMALAVVIGRFEVGDEGLY